MSVIEQIQQETAQLSTEAQLEVLNFIRFLHYQSIEKRLAHVLDNDEVSRLLQQPLQVLEAKPMSRSEIYER